MCCYNVVWRTGIMVWMVLEASLTMANAVIGPTYPIEEKNLLEVIAQKLQRKRMDGELGAISQRMKENAKQYLEHPPPVAHITSVKISSSRLFDPSITVPYDIRDAEGRLIHPADTRVNPLDYRDLSHRLLFFNGDDPNQIEWVKKKIHEEKKDVLIVVQGSPMELMQQLDTRVTFDQTGFLTQKLGITAVPVMVYQDGKQLRIDEVVP